MKWLALSIALVACGGKDVAPPEDAFPALDSLQHCQLTKSQGDPTSECLEVWACPDQGTFTLACGLDENSMPGCACVRGESTVERVVNMAPTSCTDPAVVTAFAQEQCAWSLQ